MTENNANVIKGLKPEKLWHHFGEIASIPRPSKKEEKIREYIIKIAEKNKLEYVIDRAGNIVVYKSAQNSLSNNTVILQSHIDMVCEANPDVEIDFETDPLVLRKEAGLMKASGTTLGADNGIGVATILSILEDREISHPDIEAFFTVDEETGLTGAINFDESLLNGDYLINLDTEEEGKVFTGAAGGETIVAKYNIEKENTPDDTIFLRVSVNGLRGGHSGADIHKNFGNAIKFIGFIMTEVILNNIQFNISNISGGNMKNAIPRFAEITFGINKNKKEETKRVMNHIIARIISKYKRDTEPNILIKVEEITTNIPDRVITKAQSKSIINIINCIHHGIHCVSTAVKDLVETSNNLGVISLEDDILEIMNLARSDDMLELDITMQQIISALRIIENVEITRKERYPAWKPIPKEENPLLQLFIDVHKKVTGEEPAIKAIHAGLECGYFDEKMPDTPIISIGPTIKNAHSPEEYVSINSAERFWKLLVEFLKIL